MAKGRFGIHGGQYVPEVLMNAVNELEKAYEYFKNDPQFNAELTELLNEYAGRPSRLYYAEKMSRDLGGAQIYLGQDNPSRSPCPLYALRNNFGCGQLGRRAREGIHRARFHNSLARGRGSRRKFPQE